MFINSDLISPRDPDFFIRTAGTTVKRGKEGGNFFLIVTSCYILSGSQPFLALYNSGLDTVLLAIIKSETADRVNELILSLDEEYFKVMIGFFFFMTMIFFLYNSKKIIFSNKFYDFFSLEEFQPKFLKNNIYILIALAAGLGL